MFVLGFGGGGTSYAVSTYPEVERIDSAELGHGVANVAKMFTAINHNVMADPRFYLEVNDAFEKLTGLKREDVVGKRVTVSIPTASTAPSPLTDIPNGNWVLWRGR